MDFDELPEKIRNKIKKKQQNIFSNLDLNHFGYRLKTRKTSKSSTVWIEIEYYKKLLEINRNSLKRKESQQQYSKVHKEEINARGKKYREENKEKESERHKKYNQIHKKEIKEYREKNKEKIQNRFKTWYRNNKNEILEKNKKYAKEHPDKVKEAQRKFYLNHKEEMQEKNKIYKQSKKGKESRKRYDGKRRRNMGFNSLNEPIDGIECDGHHIDKEYVIYIPRDLHQSIQHNLESGKNMFEMNMNAFEFLKQQKGIKI